MKKFILLMIAAIATLSAFGQKTYKVGDYYSENGKEGIVFWVDRTGEHGKIVSMIEADQYLAWHYNSDNHKERTRLIGADNHKDGAYNMAIVSQAPNWQSKYPAFKWCAEFGNGWYLPAIEELQLFADIFELLNLSLLKNGGMVLEEQKMYWSSTESNKQVLSNKRNIKSIVCAEVVYLGGNEVDSYTSYAPKFLEFNVRAVSIF